MIYDVNFDVWILQKGCSNMPAKVYWISLETTLQITRRYIQRNQIKLQQNLTGPQYDCVVAVLNAILECLQALPTNTPNV